MGYALIHNGETVRDHWGKQIIFEEQADADSFLAGENKFVGMPPPGVTVKPTHFHASGNPSGASFPEA